MSVWHNTLAETLPLDGEWRFSLAGQQGAIRVPGCWEAQGYPRRVDGPAVYEREIVVPAAWAGRRVQLQFEAVSYDVEATINGVPVGRHSGSWAPFALDVTAALRFGATNTIRLTVYKQGERFPLRESLAGFLPDVVMMFGGVWGSARLVAFPGPALSDLRVLTEMESGRIRVTGAVAGADVEAGLRASVQVTHPDGRVVAVWAGSPVEGQLSASVVVPDPMRWEPANPARYTVAVRLEDGRGTTLAAAERRVGFRALTRQGEQLLFNGQPICLRGVLNWGWYPEVLCPAPDEATIRAEFARVRALGYNLIKLCLFVPSRLYFDLADELGMFLWLELPMWLPEVTPRLREQAPREYAEILDAVHHHPSVILYSLGCELGHSVDAELLGRLDGIVRGATGGVLVCDNSGSGEAYGGLAFDFADFNDYHFYCDLHFFEPLVDHFSRDWRPPRPWIFGEFCDADDYRDLNEIAQAFGGELPWWFTEWNPLHPRTFVGYPAQRERMQKLDLGLGDAALMRLSRRQSFVVRKTILEKVRARAGMGGYVVTSIRDTPLASSSMFDDLGRSKYDPEAFRQFNADSVLLLGRGRARRWTHGGDRPAPFEPYSFPAGQAAGLEIVLAHAGPSLPGGRLVWEVVDAAGRRIGGGEAAVSGPLTGGRPRSIGRAVFAAPPSDRAVTLRLQASFTPQGRPAISNSWSLWIFPVVSAWPAGLGVLDPNGALSGLDDLLEAARRVETPDAGLRVLITNVLTDDVLSFARGGGRVLLIQHGDRPLPARAVPFWREGIGLIGDHPVLAAMPHDGVLDLQFYGLATDRALDTARLAEVLPDAAEVRTPLRRLDARQFDVTDYLLEMRLGAGRLAATTLRFQGGLGDQPVGLRAHLAGRWLLLNLLQYLAHGEA